MDDSQERRGGATFAGPIPALYEGLLVPMIFQAAATQLAAVVAERSPRDILETAAGTGVLTRALVAGGQGSNITATDLNQPMLDVAAGLTPRGVNVTWRQADALDLPFEDDSFDVVVCQFGVMFFADKVDGYREAARVLRSAGSFIFNVWDRIERNEVPFIIESALNEIVPKTPLGFMSGIPHGYFSPEQIRTDLLAAGLEAATITGVDATARTTPADAAIAFCQGTPLRIELENHPTLDVVKATALAENALVRHFGPAPFEAPIRSLEVIARPVG